MDTDSMDSMSHNDFMAAVKYGAVFDPSLSADLQNFLVANGIRPVIADQLPAEVVLASTQASLATLPDEPLMPDMDHSAAFLTFRLQSYLFQNRIPPMAAQKMTATYLLQCTKGEQAAYLADHPEEDEYKPSEAELPDIMDSPFHSSFPEEAANYTVNPASTVMPMDVVCEPSPCDSLFNSSLGESSAFEKSTDLASDFSQAAATFVQPEQAHHENSPAAQAAVVSGDSFADQGSDEDAEHEEESLESGESEYILPLDFINGQFWQLALNTRNVFTSKTIQTPAIAALVPADDAICSQYPNKEYYAFMEDNVAFIACRLPAVIVTLVRAGRVNSALRFGQYAIDLLGHSIFTNMVADFEQATTHGDDVEFAKMCLADCIDIISELLDKALGRKLQAIVMEQEMWYYNPNEMVADAPKKEKTKSKAASRAPRGEKEKGKGVAKRVAKKKKRRVVDDEDDYE